MSTSQIITLGFYSAFGDAEISSDSDGQIVGALLPPTMHRVCHFGWRRLLVTGFLVDYARMHFQPGGIAEPDLDSLTWRNSPDSPILIEDIGLWNPKTTGKRPAILVKPGSMQQRPMGLGSRVGTSREGHDSFSTFWVGSHTIFALGENDTIAELLADELYRDLVEFSGLFISEYKMVQFNVGTVDPPVEIEEVNEHSAVPFTVTWAIEESWEVRQESLKLRRIRYSNIIRCDGE